MAAARALVAPHLWAEMVSMLNLAALCIAYLLLFLGGVTRQGCRRLSSGSNFLVVSGDDSILLCISFPMAKQLGLSGSMLVSSTQILFQSIVGSL